MHAGFRVLFSTKPFLSLQLDGFFPLHALLSVVPLGFLSRLRAFPYAGIEVFSRFPVNIRLDFFSRLDDHSSSSMNDILSRDLPSLGRRGDPLPLSFPCTKGVL